MLRFLAAPTVRCHAHAGSLPERSGGRPPASPRRGSGHGWL